MLLKPLHTAVRGAVVHHQDLKFVVNLQLQRLKTGFHEF